jgi:hypothetical protein
MGGIRITKARVCSHSPLFLPQLFPVTLHLTWLGPVVYHCNSAPFTVQREATLSLMEPTLIKLVAMPTAEWMLLLAEKDVP